MLRKVMDKLIAGVRPAFIQGCEILVGVLIENKVVDEVRRLKRVSYYSRYFEKVYGLVDGASWSLSYGENKIYDEVDSMDP